jgi:hypothetical protein
MRKLGSREENSFVDCDAMTIFVDSVKSEMEMIFADVDDANFSFAAYLNIRSNSSSSTLTL